MVISAALRMSGDEGGDWGGGGGEEGDTNAKSLAVILP